MSTRDNCFDFLRFIFALNVVIGHLTVIALFPQLQTYRSYFHTGLSVTGFFVISGFLIAQSYERSSLKLYFAKRTRRLLPAYLFVVLASAFGLVFLSDLPAREYFASIDWWKYLGANISFLNFLHPWLPGVFNSPLINDNCVNPALWTLKIEVGFYLIIPLLMLWLRKSKRPWVVLMLLYVFALLYQEGMSFWARQANIQMPVFLARQLPGYLNYFAVGMAGYIYKDVFLRYKHHLIFPSILTFAIEWYLGTDIFFSLAWGVIVLWCAYSLSAFNNFAKYGDISYGIYIYHSVLLKIMLTIGCFSMLGVFPASILYVGFVLLTGFGSWHLLEKHFLKHSKT